MPDSYMSEKRKNHLKKLHIKLKKDKRYSGLWKTVGIRIEHFNAIIEKYGGMDCFLDETLGDCTKYV